MDFFGLQLCFDALWHYLNSYPVFNCDRNSKFITDWGHLINQIRLKKSFVFGDKNHRKLFSLTQFMLFLILLRRDFCHVLAKEIKSYLLNTFYFKKEVKQVLEQCP